MSWLQSIQTGGETGFKSFFVAHYKQVYRFVKRQTESDLVAEDLTQQVFIKLWERRAILPPEVALDTQLFQIARTTLIDFYRAETTRQQAVATFASRQQAEDEQTADLTASRLKRVHEAIEQLPPRRREIFQLSRREGLTYDEIAEELSISKHTVHVQISKALFSLRNKLAGWLL